VSATPASALETTLADGLAALGIAADAGQQRGLLAYVALLAKWNRVYNLTAVREPRQMVVRHILDSLAVLPYLHGRRVLDVGTGGGLPGIPLALLSPEREFVLLDSNGKKTRFVQQAVLELGLDNVGVVHARVEAWRPAQAFDTVISRAFASIGDMLNKAGTYCVEDGRLLAMKGALPEYELASLPAGFEVVAIHRLRVPGMEDEQRHLVCLAPAHHGHDNSGKQQG